MVVGSRKAVVGSFCAGVGMGWVPVEGQYGVSTGKGLLQVAQSPAADTIILRELRCPSGRWLSSLLSLPSTVIVVTDDGNWIHPAEWERAAEELTWERVRKMHTLG